VQATEEWKALIGAFDERMAAYEDENLQNFTDDANMTRTKELTKTVTTLRRFRDVLAKSIAAWNNFSLNGISCFEIQDGENIKLDWEELLGDIRGSITEMVAMHLHLNQKLGLFDSMRNAVSPIRQPALLAVKAEIGRQIVSASSLKESAESTSQGTDIGVLTKMTVVYLPLMFACHYSAS